MQNKLPCYYSQSSGPAHFHFHQVMFHVYKFRLYSSLRNVKWSSNIIFLPYPMLRKAQLLMSLSLPAHNQSILFLMGCMTKVWQIDLHCTACPKIDGNTQHSRLGRVRVVWWVILEPNPPCAVLCCWPFLLASIYQRSYQSETGHIPGMDTGTIS